MQMLTREDLLPSLLSLAYKFIHNKTDAEDIVQDAIADFIYQNTEGIEKLNPFLKAVVVNKAKAEYSKHENGKANLTVINPEEMFIKETVFHHLEVRHIISAVKQNRDQLDFTLFEMKSEGYSYEEIAQHTGHAAGTLRQRMFQIRKWLKQNYDR